MKSKRTNASRKEQKANKDKKERLIVLQWPLPFKQLQSMIAYTKDLEKNK